MYCVVQVTFARKRKEVKPLFKQTLKITFRIITSLWVVFGLSTVISNRILFHNLCETATALRRRPFSACNEGNRRRLHAGNQTGCRCILLISARGFATSWRNVNILVLLRGWSMFTSHTAYKELALYVFPGLHFIAASLLYLLSQETISFGHRHTCVSVASLKFLALKFSDSIFGQNNFPCF